MNRKDLRALTLVGPLRDNHTEIDFLAVLHLNNPLCVYNTMLRKLPNDLRLWWFRRLHHDAAKCPGPSPWGNCEARSWRRSLQIRRPKRSKTTFERRVTSPTFRHWRHQRLQRKKVSRPQLKLCRGSRFKEVWGEIHQALLSQFSLLTGRSMEKWQSKITVLKQFSNVQ